MIDLTINKFGIKCWWRHRLLHRTNGHARIVPGGAKEYWLNGLMHRSDGSAVQHANGRQEYWVNGSRVSEYEHMFIATLDPV